MSLLDLITFPHFILILIGLIFITIAITMVLIHKPSKWLILHKYFAALGVVLVFIGVIILTGLILNITHGILGLISVILFPVALVTGWIAIQKKKKEIRTTHIWLSRIVYFISFIALILGILYFI